MITDNENMSPVREQRDVHPVSLVVETITVVGDHTLAPAVRETASVAGTVASGVLEVAVDDRSPDTIEYDADCCRLRTATGSARSGGRSRSRPCGFGIGHAVGAIRLRRTQRFGARTES